MRDGETVILVALGYIIGAWDNGARGWSLVGSALIYATCVAFVFRIWSAIERRPSPGELKHGK